MKKYASAVLAIAAISCGGQQAPTISASSNPCANPCAVNPCANPCAIAAAAGTPSADFADWATWIKKTPARFQSKAHRNTWVAVYTDEAASAAFDAKKGPYPVGARIVKAQYVAQEGGAVQSLTVMKKMAAGYDTENGDWYYGVLGADATVTMEGKLEACSGCHDSASDSDYVFAQTE